MPKKWQIKGASQQSKLSEDTIRFYEKEGLIKPERGGNGYRQYTEKQVTELRYIAVMKYAHFSVKEIRSFMELINSPSSEQCNTQGKELLSKKRADLQQAIGHYRQILQLLEELPMPESYSEFVDKKLNVPLSMDTFVEKLFNSIYNEGNHESY